MHITVLGSGAAYPRAGGSCSGFLVTSGATNVWIDAGTGTLGRLQEHIPLRDVDALVITHIHTDHIADIIPLMYALGFDPQLPVATLPVHAPRDVGAQIGSTLGGKTLEVYNEVFDFKPLEGKFSIGEIVFESFKTNHPGDTYGVRMTTDWGTIVYTSDTAYYDGLAEDCRDADVLICESTWIDGIHGPEVHMWARQAGQVARDAGAKRLVLTHVWPTLDVNVAVREASEEFDGPVEAAVEGNRYSVR